METEGLVMAAQSQATFTNCIKANICHQACSVQCQLCIGIETIYHILSGCTVINNNNNIYNNNKIIITSYQVAIEL